MSRFITVEGIEGVGKSTVVRSLSQYLQQQGIAVVTTREPGGSLIAEAIRDILVGRYEEDMCASTELLLMFASRAQHVEGVIRPALDAGKWVVSDRFVDASYAYQGGGRGLPRPLIESLDQLCVDGVQPDMTLLLDAPVECCLDRLMRRGAKDRIEQESVEFFERVRAVYLQRAQASAGRIKVVDASFAPDVVFAAVCADVMPLLENS